MLEPSQLLQSIGTSADPITDNYGNLFESPDPDLSNALGWAHANAMHPQVAAWLHACSEWDSAVATKEHEGQKKRRKLCQEHDIPCTKVVVSNTRSRGTIWEGHQASRMSFFCPGVHVLQNHGGDPSL